MYKICLLYLFSLLSVATFSQSTIYDFKVKDISGGNIDLNSFQGKKILIINIASSSSRVSQYQELKQIHEQYKQSGLVVLCFPTNDFNGEPRNDQEIKEFFKVTNSSQFILCKKISVRGHGISPLYEWLTQKNKNGVVNIEVKGDYQKYLINEQGKLKGFYSGRVGLLALEKVGIFK